MKKMSLVFFKPMLSRILCWYGIEDKENLTEEAPLAKSELPLSYRSSVLKTSAVLCLRKFLLPIILYFSCLFAPKLSLISKNRHFCITSCLACLTFRPSFIRPTRMAMRTEVLFENQLHILPQHRLSVLQFSHLETHHN